jgi:hypothetical protein
LSQLRSGHLLYATCSNPLKMCQPGSGAEEHPHSCLGGCGPGRYPPGEHTQSTHVTHYIGNLGGSQAVCDGQVGRTPRQRHLLYHPLGHLLRLQLM